MSLSHRTRASRRDAVMLEGMEMARIPLRLRGSCPCALVRRAYFQRNDLFGAKEAIIVIIRCKFSWKTLYTSAAAGTTRTAHD